MWLEQKIYSFKTEKNTVNQEDILDNIYLKVNDTLTTVKLSDLFLKVNSIDFDSDDQILEVKGWSILERTVPNTGELRITDSEDKTKFTDLKLTFYSEELGNMVITEIENPIVQLSDKELTDDKVKAFDAKIIELSLSKKDETQGEGEVAPHPTPSLFNKKWEIAKARFINNGYKEYAKDNFRLLVKGSEASKTILLIELVDENKLNQFTSPEIVVDNFYQFTDASAKRKINAKLIDDKLEVEVLVEEPAPTE